MHTAQQPRRHVKLIVGVVVMAVTLPLIATRSDAQAIARPSVPTLATAISGPDGTATVAWTPGLGGGAPTSHIIQAFDLAWGYAGWTTACGSCVSVVYPGLVGTHSYRFVVYAANAAGLSVGAWVLPTTLLPSLPSAPRDVRAEARAGALKVAWLPPTNEGSTLSSYTITAVNASGDVVSSATACGTCTSGVVGNLTNGVTYTARVSARNILGDGPHAAAAPTAPTAVPPALTNVAAVPTSDGFTVTWTHNPGQTAPADWVMVQAWGLPKSYSQWIAKASDNSLTMTGLPQNTPYTLAVYPHNAAGYGAGRVLTIRTGVGACGTDALCAEVATTETTGAAMQRAHGLLNGYSASTNPQLVSQLAPKQWRVSPGSEAHLKAETTGASITAILSDAYTWATNGVSQAPWANWARYSAFVTQFVQQTKAQGRRVDYWDIENEPGSRTFTGPPATTELWYETYRVAYAAIKAADPNAKIIAPTLVQVFWVGEADAPVQLDMPGFMAFAQSHNLRFDAFSWHELGYNQGNYFDTPRRVVDNAQAARVLTSLHPNLAGSKLFINEFMPNSSYLVPGHVGGFLGALESVDIDEANTTCHEFTWGPGTASCTRATLNGALLGDERTPRGTYWVRQLYGAMSGERLKTYFTDAGVTVFATTPSPDTYKLLVARHQSCVRAINPYCLSTTSATPAPGRFTMKLDTGAAAGVTVQAVKVPVGVLAQPAPLDVSDVTTSTAGGVTTLTVPALADGDVFMLTVTAS